MPDRNLTQPGNPRYQPKSTAPYFGYDNLYMPVADVEFATMSVLADIGVMPLKDYQLLTPQLQHVIRDLTTTEITVYERAVTKHDVRAWVELAKQRMPPALARWVHVPLTSYDVIDTGRILMFCDAYDNAVWPLLTRLMRSMADLAESQIDQLQIGRTHGQHALPITAGFWLATILSRLLDNYEWLELARDGLVGKISGPVGAHNAVVGLGIEDRSGSLSFEHRVLDVVGLPAAPISTQVLPPEPLTYFLLACYTMTAAIGQFGRDCRHLMRTEIGEVAEPFSGEQSGSSTMAHKRNPISFEGLEGMADKSRNEIGKVFGTLITDHQRDLVASGPMRDFPVIVINLVSQLETLLREDKQGVPFLNRLRFFPDAMARNFDLSAKVIMAEPVYIALQMAGYTGDAHRLVNHVLMPRAVEYQHQLSKVLYDYAVEDDMVALALSGMSNSTREMLSHPENYTGDARDLALETIVRVRQTVPRRLKGRKEV